MRYIINDDDLHDWYSRLYRINKTLNNSELEYILSEIEIELDQLPFAEGVTVEDFIKLLRSKYVKE